MFRSILYVSQSNLVIPGDEWKVAAILDVSRSWNASVGVTGALMFTEQHFSQYIEGPRAAVDDLLMKIRADPRHRNVDVIRGENIPRRRFDGWDLAYSGPEVFLERDLVAILEAPLCKPRDEAANDLVDLMQRLTDGRLGADAFPDARPHY